MILEYKSNLDDDWHIESLQGVDKKNKNMFKSLKSNATEVVFIFNNRKCEVHADNGIKEMCYNVLDYMYSTSCRRGTFIDGISVAKWSMYMPSFILPISASLVACTVIVCICKLLVEVVL